MQTLRVAVLALVFLACSALTASAQLQTGSTLFFDHTQEGVADTAKYQLCVDSVTDAACVDLAVLQTGTYLAADQTPMATFSFTLPGTVARGNRVLQVRAVGFAETGASAGSNAISQRIIGKPVPPVLLRLQPAVAGGGL